MPDRNMTEFNAHPQERTNIGGGKQLFDKPPVFFDGKDPAKDTDPKPQRPFKEIQDEMESLVANPDPQKEKALRIERARLINEARSAGVDMGILGSIRRKMLDIQTNNSSIIGSAQLISQIDTDRLEQEATGVVGWNNNFEGLIEEYREGAIRNMSLVYLKKVGAPQKDIDHLQREIDLLNWGTAPSIIDTMPIQPDTMSKGFGFSAHDLAKEIAEAQGMVSPYNSLEEARQGEEFLRTAVRIVPGNEPRFWLLLNEKEKRQWHARSSLWVIAYKKSVALSSDQLCMAEMQELAVDVNRYALKILFGSRDKDTHEVEYESMDGALSAAGIYSTIISDSKFLNYKDRNDLSLKTVFCEVLDNRWTRTEIERDFGKKAFEELKEEQDVLHRKCPDSIYPHAKSYGTSIDGENFSKLRDSIRFWLMTKGRNLLLSNEESSNREAFFANKEEAYETLKLRAREAEVVAWNFIYSTGLLETFDTRAYRPEGTKRHGPSYFWSLALWTTMHLQERFEQKVLRTNSENDAYEAKEEWAGRLGTWALHNYDVNAWGTKEIGKSNTIKIPRILPDVMFSGGLIDKYVYQTERDKDLKPNNPMGKPDNPTLLGILNEIGNDVLFNTNNITRNSLESRLDLNEVSNTPFVSYVWDEIRWGNIVEKCFKKGNDSKLDLRDYGEALRNLRIPTKIRLDLLKIYYGLDVKSPVLKYAPGIEESGILSGVRDEYPVYFLEK